MTYPAGIWLIEDVAREIGRTVDWIHRNRRALEAAGFPPPLPRLTRKERLRWREHEVKAWTETARLGMTPPANDTRAADDARGRMNRRLGNL